MEGAITLTLILGAYSAANDLARPSIAAFAVATLEWNGIPCDTATVLKKTRLGLFDEFSLGRIDLRTFISDNTLISKSCLNESMLNPLKGLKLILPCFQSF